MLTDQRLLVGASFPLPFFLWVRIQPPFWGRIRSQNTTTVPLRARGRQSLELHKSHGCYVFALSYAKCFLSWVSGTCSATGSCCHKPGLTKVLGQSENQSKQSIYDKCTTDTVYAASANGHSTINSVYDIKVGHRNTESEGWSWWLW